MQLARFGLSRFTAPCRLSNRLRPYWMNETLSQNQGKSVIHTLTNTRMLPQPSINTEFLPTIIKNINYSVDTSHRYVLLTHLLNDTMHFIQTIRPHIQMDAVIGLPYSRTPELVLQKWRSKFGPIIHLESNLSSFYLSLQKQLAESLADCAQQGQRLIALDCDGFVLEALHSPALRPLLPHVRGVVEITKQGVWRSEALGDNLQVPLFHCANSELKRLEYTRCGETVAGQIDTAFRELGLSAAGRKATVVGYGWMGEGVARALKRLDMVVSVVDVNPVKLFAARMNGFEATTDMMGMASSSELVVGTTGKQSITRSVLDVLPEGVILASASSRRLEVDVKYLENVGHQLVLGEHVSADARKWIEAFSIPCHEHYTRKKMTGKQDKYLYLLNQGYPVNFVSGSQSVPDEVIQPILAQLIILMKKLSVAGDIKNGIHAIGSGENGMCAELWLRLRDECSQ